MRFTKMQGAGNDYIYVNCFSEPAPDDPGDVARKISDRHFGVGGDGLVLIHPAKHADARMQMFNADGSEAEMCGNAIRCVAKLVYEQGKIVEKRMRVETGNGLLILDLQVENGKVPAVRVDMGPPGFSPAGIGIRLQGERIIEQTIEADGRTFEISCVSMGNPHAVIFLDEPVEDFPVARYGPAVENNPLFINRTNVEFVNVRGKNKLRQRTWERGTGETLACGTGACAVAVASILTGRCSPGTVEIQLNGGWLSIHWQESENVFMTGPAEQVYTGCWPE